MRLSYDGTDYHGWQIQPHDNSVQETLERALSMALHQPVSITGAGRTDTGVHARTMVAHFDVPEPIARPELLCHQVNGIVGRSIAVHSIFPVADDAHARFDATSRTYRYFVHTQHSPFLYRYSCWVRPTIDFSLMNEAASHLLHYRDFTSFSRLHTDVKTNNCDVRLAQWTPIEGSDGQWMFTITADRFLRNMVRAIVGTLFDVGMHKITVSDFDAIIEGKNRCKAGQSAPGNALFLWDITYPYPIG